jgi:hypothetical protein
LLLLVDNEVGSIRLSNYLITLIILIFISGSIWYMHRVLLLVAAQNFIILYYVLLLVLLLLLLVLI